MIQHSHRHIFFLTRSGFLLCFLLSVALTGNCQTKNPRNAVVIKNTPPSGNQDGPLANDPEAKLRANKMIEPQLARIALLTKQLPALDLQRQETLKTRAMKRASKSSTAQEDARLQDLQNKVTKINREVLEIQIRIRNIEIGTGIRRAE